MGKDLHIEMKRKIAAGEQLAQGLETELFNPRRSTLHFSQALTRFA